MNGYHVLVVEDDAATGDTLRRLLGHRGLVVDVARSVTEGMRFLRSKPHCIILDLMLPDGDGEDFDGPASMRVVSPWKRSMAIRVVKVRPFGGRTIISSASIAPLIESCC